MALYGLSVSLSISQETYESRICPVPEMKSIQVDGDVSDWGIDGMRIEFLTDPRGRALRAGDFDVRFRLGWNREGLLVLADVWDDVPVEQESLSRMWRSDCVEILLSERVGSDNRYHLVIAPGADPRFDSARKKMYDHRPEDQRDDALNFFVASQVRENGYVVEALLPWKNLGIEPADGVELGFQLAANDDDGPSDIPENPIRVSWFPSLDSHWNADHMIRIRLGAEPGEPVFYRVDREIGMGYCAILVRGSEALLGESVIIRQGNSVPVRAVLERMDDRSGIRFQLDPEKHQAEWPELQVTVGEDRSVSFPAIVRLERILSRYIEAVGGEQAVRELTTRICEGNYEIAPEGGDGDIQEYPFEAIGKSRKKWMVSLSLPDGTEQNGFDGQTGWVRDSDRIRIDDGMGRSNLAYLLDPQAVLHIREYFPDMALKSMEVIDGREAFIVEPALSRPASYTLYFDAETGLLNRIGDSWELLDYRAVDNVRLPYRIVIHHRGGTRTFAFDRVEHNHPLKDDRFFIPEASTVYADAFQGIESPDVLPMLQMKTLTYRHGEMNVPCRDGRFLYDLIIDKQYKKGLEIGTYNGYSTLWIGLAFQKTGGRVVTIEIDSTWGRVARENFQMAGLEKVIDSRINDASEEIPRLNGKFDFVFIDAWKPDYVKFLNLLKDRMEPGGAIVAHNVTNYAQDMREYLEAIENDPDLETSFYPISAEGIALSIYRPGR
jgi:predicted O-methyltransferase YrrM